jgi:ribosome biogenesis GTPase
MTTSFTLSQLGWSTFFQQQLTLDEWEGYYPARVVAHHRTHLDLISEQGATQLQHHDRLPPMTVGDWLLLNSEGCFHRCLERLSLFSRKAPGRTIEEQLIAANINTVFVVVSLNADFNLNRIERYLALIKEAESEPVVVLTKADLCEDPDQYLQQVRSLDPLLMVEAVNALDAHDLQKLEAWLTPGSTVALLGSSGVGKSTLLNTITDSLQQKTAAIRDDDGKGRHTTTARSLHLSTRGALIVDTPGMRELQLADCEHGVEETFAEITQLANQCRYKDCEHDQEPGCAVRQAIEEGTLEARRLQSFHKLKREQQFNAATLAEKRAKDRSFSRMCRRVQSGARHRKQGNNST